MVSSATVLHNYQRKRLKISNCENPELDSHASIGYYRDVASSLLPITEECFLHGYYFTPLPNVFVFYFGFAINTIET